MTEFKNIILDLGGVVFDIDYNKTIRAFEKLAVINAGDVYSKSSQVKLFDELEKGNISEDDFYSGMRNLGQSTISNDQIRDAWNAMLIGLPEENVKFLSGLKKNHRLFLLSNTNSIHEKAYKQMIIDQYGSLVLDDLFEKTYLSHHLHLRKPDLAVFRYVLNDSNLNSNETCFIDDSIQHVEGAVKAGIRAFHLKDERLSDFIRTMFND